MKYFAIAICFFTQQTFAASQILIGDYVLNMGDTQVQCDTPVKLNLNKSILDHVDPCTNKLKVLPPKNKSSILVKLSSESSDLNIESQLNSAEFKPQSLETQIGNTLINWNFLNLLLPEMSFQCSKPSKNFLTSPSRDLLKECLKLSQVVLQPIQIKTDALAGSTAKIQVNITNSQLVGKTKEINLDTGNKSTQLKNVSFSAYINVDALNAAPNSEETLQEALSNMQVFIEKMNGQQSLEAKSIIDIDRVFNAKISLSGQHILLRAKYDFIIKSDIEANMRYELQESPRAMLIHIEKGTFNGLSMTSIMSLLLKRLVADQYLKVKGDTITILY